MPLRIRLPVHDALIIETPTGEEIHLHYQPGTTVLNVELRSKTLGRTLEWRWWPRDDGLYHIVEQLLIKVGLRTGDVE